MMKLDERTVNNIINQLQANRNNIEWNRVKARNCYDTFEKYNIILEDEIYSVYPLMSYNTVVAFLYFDTLYECGKYSATTSKQVTLWYNENGIHKRVFVNKIYV